MKVLPHLACWVCLAGLGATDPAQPWSLTRTTTFKEESLFAHINGGAELFLETGFDRLEVRHLKQGRREVTLEFYWMKDPEAALAIYLGRCGTETPMKGFGFRHTAGPLQILALKGRCMASLNRTEGSNADLPEVAKLLADALATVPDERPRDLWAGLPLEGRVPGSEFLARGPLGLQNVFWFGEGDALSQGGRVWAVGADFQSGKGPKSTRLRLTYGDGAEAQAALSRLRQLLDPSLTVVRWAPPELAFRDAQKRHGRARLEGAVLSLDLFLQDAP